MNVVVVTSVPLGIASLCLPKLSSLDENEVRLVILTGSRSDLRRELRRKIRKIRRIGVAGALNGKRIRNWFGVEPMKALGVEPVDVVAHRLGIPVVATAHVNSHETASVLRDVGAEVALSLGNGYIREEIFSIPRYGMLNVHLESLPGFRGAQSVIWQLHEGSVETGYTIHRIDARIDTGPIFHAERLPIIFKETLRDTVIYNCIRLHLACRDGLTMVMKDFHGYADRALPQGNGKSFTTPTFREFRQMVRMHDLLRRQHATVGGPARGESIHPE